jgi:beta-lactamase regulating signal transducer with metallopeptidase domain
MAVTFHHFMSLYSFIMGVMWFNVFVVLGLVMRKLKFPLKFSVVPLIILLVLSILRMFIAVEIPGTVIILSETLYPAVVSILRYEIVSYFLFGVPINIANIFIFVWIVGAVWLIVRYFYKYVSRFGFVMNWVGSYERDEHAEALLSNLIGKDKRFSVFRNGCFNTAVATAFKPYIILPEVEFSDDELRIILLHEWKHIQDKDYLTGIIVNVICFVFWWNPLVYVLRRNFRFAQELKSDQFAVSDEKDFDHFLDGLLLLDKAKKEKRSKYGGANAFITGDDGIEDRLEVLALREGSRGKRIFYNAIYSVAILIVFIASYSFIVLPAFWTPDVTIVDDFTIDYLDIGGVFLPEENFIFENADGMFSLYIDGHFVMYIDISNELLNLLPVRTRECD